MKSTERNRLIGALIGLSHAARDWPEVESGTASLLREGLCAVRPGEAPDASNAEELLMRLHEEKTRLAPHCSVCPSPCGRTADFDPALLKKEEENVRSLKTLLLLGLCALASDDAASADLLAEGLSAVGEAYDAEGLRPLLKKIGEENYRFLCPED